MEFHSVIVNYNLFDISDTPSLQGYSTTSTEVRDDQIVNLCVEQNQASKSLYVGKTGILFYCYKRHF